VFPKPRVGRLLRESRGQSAGDDDLNGHGASFEAKEEDTGAEHAIGDTRVDPLANTLPPAGYSDEMFDENNQHHDVRRQGGRGRAGDGPLRDDPPVDDDVDAVPTRIEHGFSVSAAGESTGPHLVVIGGNNRGEEFALGDREYSIGRGLDNDVVLAMTTR